MKSFYLIAKLLFFLIISFNISTTNLNGQTPLDWQFPKDHGAHPNYDVEWWYFTGHLTDTDGDLHGYQVTFFRNKLDTVTEDVSIWNAPEFYTAHFGFINGKTGKYVHEERSARSTFSIASVSSQNMDITLYDWKLKKEGNMITISINSEIGLFKLNLTPAKKLVFHGNNGVSKKSANNSQFSHYYSYTRLEGDGSLIHKNNQITFKQHSSWMDREIFDQYLDNSVAGWDWFALQLDDNSEIMIGHVRGDAPFKFGTHIDKDGNSSYLSHDDIQLTIIDTWKSKKTAHRYPIEWDIKIISLNKTFRVKARVNDQELSATKPFPQSYWEGQCDVSGSENGLAYMELVGYDSD